MIRHNCWRNEHSDTATLPRSSRSSKYGKWRCHLASWAIFRSAIWLWFSSESHLDLQMCNYMLHHFGFWLCFWPPASSHSIFFKILTHLPHHSNMGIRHHFHFLCWPAGNHANGWWVGKFCWVVSRPVGKLSDDNGATINACALASRDVWWLYFFCFLKFKVKVKV